MSHIKILDVREVTRSKFDTEEPNNMDATLKKNIVAQATQCLGFTHRCEVGKHNTRHQRILANK